jgi:mannan endo-1,4-beta-mannosidase
MFARIANRGFYGYGELRQVGVQMDVKTRPLNREMHAVLDEPLRFGVSTPGGWLAARELQTVADAVGRRAEMVMSFEDFFAEPPVAAMAVASYCGADPIVSWEPWCWTNDRSPAVMQALLSGALDEYLHRWAAQLRDWGATAYIRFAHEFNGDWYPWTPTGGTPATKYVKAWRRLHDIFSAEHAANVKWVWAPSVVGSGALADWYPGDDCVDVFGVDGFNWGASMPWTQWVDPEDLFGTMLDQLRIVSPDKPILVTEVGCAEAGGRKGDWITRLVDFLSRQHDVMGFVWFEHDRSTDWRMTSSSDAAAAMAGALRNASIRAS